MVNCLVHCIRKAVILFLRLVLSLYFKEVQVIGTENVPKEGPVIFVGNHANQYIDPMSICAYSPHHISFLVAAVTYRQKMLGFFCRLFAAIPVERPQDIAQIGKGTIEFGEVDEANVRCTITGHDSQFKKQAVEGDSIKVKGLPDYVISEIISDTEMVVKAKQKLKCEPGTKHEYKVAPKVDQSHVFQSVWDELKNGKCIGIFPEGGSHDQTNLLPLKVGVAIMALGAMDQYKDLKVKVVACGLKYFHPNKFRSRMILEFSQPFTVDEYLAKEYKIDKRTACSKLLTKIENSMRSVTFSAPSFKELRSIYLARRLYIPSTEEKQYSEVVINDLYKRFFKGYNQCRDEPEVQEVFKDVYDYGQQLKSLALRDSQVYEVHLNNYNIFKMILISSIRLFFSLIFVLPGLITLAPLHFLNKILAERERVRALKKSQVKVVAADVMGSTKILTSFILYPTLCIFFTVSLFLIQLWYTNLTYGQNIENCIWFILFFPTYNYICIRSIDGVVDNYNNLAIRIWALFSYDTMKNIRDRREALAKSVNTVIDKYGPTVFKDFDKMKLVPGLKKKKKTHRKSSQEHDSDNSSQGSYVSSFIIDEFDFDMAFNSLSEIGI